MDRKLLQPGNHHQPQYPAATPSPSTATTNNAMVVPPRPHVIAGGIFLSASAGLVTAVLLFIIIHLVYQRRRHDPSHGHNRRLRRSLALNDPDSDTSGPPPPAHGLDSSVLASIPVITISSTAGDCAVCLTEFEQGDQARALPRCGHCFHVQCIDMWFQSHVTCPLCRGDVESGFGVEEEEAVVAGKETRTDEGRMVIPGRISSGGLMMVGNSRDDGSDLQQVSGAEE